MRNFGLALVLIATVIAPHAAMAKKHVAKKGRSAKAQKHLKRAHQSRGALAPNSSDTLASAVAEHKTKPTLTSAVAKPDPEPSIPAASPAPASGTLSSKRAAEPVAPNAPMTMENQSSDDEVPGSRKKK